MNLEKYNCGLNLIHINKWTGTGCDEDMEDDFKGNETACTACAVSYFIYSQSQSIHSDWHVYLSSMHSLTLILLDRVRSDLAKNGGHFQLIIAYDPFQ